MGRAEDARRGCALTLTFGRRGPRSPEEEDAYEERVADASILKEPSVWRYRVTKRYGYMCFDFVEFMDFFRNGSDAPTRALGADWSRAAYFLNGKPAPDRETWIASGRRALRRIGGRAVADGDALVRMSTQAILGHPCHWLHLLMAADGVVVQNAPESMFLYGEWGKEKEEEKERSSSGIDDETNAYETRGGRVALTVRKQMLLTKLSGRSSDSKRLATIGVVVSVDFGRKTAEFSWAIR